MKTHSLGRSMFFVCGVFVIVVVVVVVDVFVVVKMHSRGRLMLWCFRLYRCC